MGHVRKRGERQYQSPVERIQVFKRRIDAENHIKTKEAEVLHGTYIDTTNKITVAKYARQWAAIRPHRPATATRIKSMIDTHIADTPLGRTRLSAVRDDAVEPRGRPVRLSRSIPTGGKLSGWRGASDAEPMPLDAPLTTAVLASPGSISRAVCCNCGALRRSRMSPAIAASSGPLPD
jgi:hypothetical protein